MWISSAKSEILKKEGYRYHFLRGLYYNRHTKKIFSEEAVDDNPEEWLKDKISEENKYEWMFYFNTVPTAEQLNEILQDIQ